MTSNGLTINNIKEKLARQVLNTPINNYSETLFDSPPQPAAVLIPMLRMDDDWRLLFIRRTEVEGDLHSGQVAFPGGRRDSSDPSIEAAALREAQEEIGLDPADVHIIGRLQDFITITNYQVTPIVGFIPWPYPLEPSPDEVSRTFTIPLDWLMDPANREEKQKKIPGHEPHPVIYFKPFDDEVLWGASALFTLNFLDAIR